LVLSLPSLGRLFLLWVNYFAKHLHGKETRLIFASSNKPKSDTMNTQVTFESEWKRRMDLVEDPKFREIAIETAKKMGITAEQWNANRAGLLLMFANEICSLENKQK